MKKSVKICIVSVFAVVIIVGLIVNSRAIGKNTERLKEYGITSEELWCNGYETIDESGKVIDSDEAGYYCLHYNDGRLCIHDGEAGNPGINYRVSTVKGNKLVLRSSDADFDPPKGWENMSKDKVILTVDNKGGVIGLTFEDKKTKSKTTYYFGGMNE